MDAPRASRFPIAGQGEWERDWNCPFSRYSRDAFELIPLTNQVQGPYHNLRTKFFPPRFMAQARSHKSWGKKQGSVTYSMDREDENKIQFTMVDVDEQKQSDFENVSPLGFMPLLQDGNLNIYGSQAIIFYLAEKYTNYAGFGKSEENERLLIESVINWAATTLLRDVGSNYVYPSLSQPEDALRKEGNASLVEFGKTEVFFHLDTLEKHYLSQRDFLCCTVPTLADSWIAMVLSLLELVSLDLAPWPKVKSWMDSMKASSDYVDVSCYHEEMVRKRLCGLNNSTSDLKTVDTDPVT